MPETGKHGARELAEQSYLGLYRAGITDPARRQHVTVARTAILDNTVECLRESIGRKSKHHFLFIGSRGSGKSHFLSLVEDEIRKDESLTDAFHAVRFPEEAHRVLSFADFLLGLCEILRDTAPDEPAWAELYGHLHTEEDNELIVDTLVPRIRRENRERKRSLLVMLENVNELFGRQIKDRKDIGALRKFFTTDNGCHLIATAPIHFDAITDVGQPFYDFFDVQLVENFSQDETLLFIRRNLEWEKREDLLQDFEALRPKLTAMYQMTGGSPRLTVMLYELLAHDSVVRVRDQLQILLDRITPFYQDRLSDLPPQERAVLETMATMRDQPKTPKKVAARMRMSQAQTSSLLKRLATVQYLRVHDNPEDRRSRLYTIREGFFDIWLAMNLSRGSRGRLPFLVDFFEVFYADTQAREFERQEQMARLEREETEDAAASLDLLSEVGGDRERAISKIDLASHYATRGNSEQSAFYFHEANTLTNDSLSHWITARAEDGPSEDYLSAIEKMIDAWSLHRSGELEGFARHLQDLGEKLDQRTYSEARLSFLADRISTAEGVDGLVRLRLRISDLLEGLARWDDAEEHLASAQDEAALSKNRLLTSDVIHKRGNLKMRRYDFEGARALYEEALSIRRKYRDRAREASTLGRLGDLEVQTFDLDRAGVRYAEALQICQTIGDRLGEANTLRAVGGLRMRVDDLVGAGHAYEQALPIFRKVHGRLGEANTLWALGNLRMRVSDLDRAGRAYEQALPIFREIHGQLGEANTLRALGDLRIRFDDQDAASRAYEQALPIFREIHDRLGEANTLRALGDLRIRFDKLDEAGRAYEEALTIFRKIHDRLGEANTLQALGDLKMRVDDLDGASRVYEEALPIFRMIHDRLGEANTLQALGDLRIRLDELDEAGRAYEQALPIFQAIHERLGEANTLQALGNLRRRVNDLDGAGRTYEQALPIYREIHDRLGETNTLGGLGNLHLAQGRVRESFESHLSALAIHRHIKNSLGEAASHGYLMRTALQAGRSRQGIALALVTVDILTDIGDRFGLMLLHEDLARAFAEDDSQASIAAAYRCWKLAEEIGDPSREARRDVFMRLTKDELLEPAHEALLRDLEGNAEERIAAALEEVREAVARGEVDPYEIPQG